MAPDIFTQVANLSVSLTLGLIVAYVAYQQWRTNSLRLKHEIFDRRMEVYNRVQDALGELLQGDTFSSGALNDFRLAARNSEFLFPKHVCSHLEEIWAAARKHYLQTDKLQKQGERSGAETTRKTLDELEDWLQRQPKQVHHKMLPFLRLYNL
jgi:hypothetical protein